MSEKASSPESFQNHPRSTRNATGILLWVLAACVVLGAAYFFWNRDNHDPVSSIAQQREALDETIWAQERLAQEHETYFVELWDQLRDPDLDKREVLADASFQTLVVGDPGEPEELDWNILLRPFTAPERTLTPEQWRAELASLQEAGYELLESEWHHSNFELDENDQAHSVVSFLLHVVNRPENARYTIRGALKVDWLPREGDETPQPDRIAVQDMTVMSRQGSPDFSQVEPIIGCGAAMHHLVLVYDLDDDGLPEIIVPSINIVVKNNGGFDLTAEADSLATVPPSRDTYAAVLADFNNDGRADLFCAAVDEIPQLYLADGEGKFTQEPLPIEAVPDPFVRPSVVTAGDVNGDGNLDAWIGQYRDIFEEGSMPTPYYDANDGYPAYLLLGDGQGGFTEATEESGLAPKRNRRTYSASFVDLNGDGSLDLAVSSDYAGLDLYYNDGEGHFTDVTQDHVDKADAFGMGFTFADYNQDGLLDIYLIGMSSTTARRLTAMGLGREEEEFASYQDMRPEMGYGNRMLLGTRDAEGNISFQQAPFNDDVARTGWSWGTTSLDFDNDGDRDIYVANGFKSRRTAKDYCTRFWTHDIYTGNSEANEELNQFFQDMVSQAFHVEGMSWNGFEHNCLYMNQNGEGFANIAFVMDSALENDSREVVGADFDADGRVDLLVGTVDMLDDGRQVVRNFRILENLHPRQNHWIGVRLREQGHGYSPLGAVVVVQAEGKQQMMPVVSGDSLWSQHAPIVNFGLGDAESVDWIEIRWPNRPPQRFTSPPIDRYFDVPAEPGLARRDVE